MPDIKSSIIAAVATAFETLASVRRPIILQWPPGAYDPASDLTAPGPQSATIYGFIYAEENKQGTASSGFSGTMLLQSSDVVAAGVTGRLEEAVKAIVDGVTYEVEYVGYDPVAATVKFLARHG